MAAEETTVYSVRLNRRDVDALKAVAQRKGMKVGEAIREAVSAFRGADRATSIEITTPSGMPSAVTIQFQGESANSRTLGVVAKATPVP